MNRRNLIIGSIVAFVLLGITALLFHGKKGAAGNETKPDDPNLVELTVDAQRNANLVLAETREGQIKQMVKATGIVSPDETRLAHIFPLAQGVVEKVYVRLGDHVQKGQPLLVYDNIELGELIGEHLSLHGQLQREMAQKQVAAKKLERAKALIGVEGISPREYEERQAEALEAEAAVQSKRADLFKVEEKLHRFGLSEAQVEQLRVGEEGGHRTASHNILRAPFVGVITKYDVAQGELVSREKEVFTLVDTSMVWVLGDVYEKDIGRVPRTGQCLVTVASYPDQKFVGKIAYISDFLDPTSRTAKARCVVPNEDRRLKLEMFADVLMPTTERSSALIVPSAAVQEVNGDSVVFVQRDTTHFEKRMVKVGERTEEQAQVLDGLRAGEKVVSNGSFHLKTALLREQIGED